MKRNEKHKAWNKQVTLQKLENKPLDLVNQHPLYSRGAHSCSWCVPQTPRSGGGSSESCLGHLGPNLSKQDNKNDEVEVMKRDDVRAHGMGCGVTFDSSKFESWIAQSRGSSSVSSGRPRKRPPPQGGIYKHKNQINADSIFSWTHTYVS